jgi:hypothetical protein
VALHPEIIEHAHRANYLLVLRAYPEACHALPRFSLAGQRVSSRCARRIDPADERDVASRRQR